MATLHGRNAYKHSVFTEPSRSDDSLAHSADRSAEHGLLSRVHDEGRLRHRPRASPRPPPRYAYAGRVERQPAKKPRSTWADGDEPESYTIHIKNTEPPAIRIPSVNCNGGASGGDIVYVDND